MLAKSILRFLLLGLLVGQASAAEIRRTPWVWPATQQAIVDGYAWSSAADVTHIQLHTPGGNVVQLPYLPATPEALPLVSATAWHQQDQWQIIVRATSEDFLRNCRIVLVTTTGAVSLNFLHATYGTLLQRRQWQGQDINLYYGGAGPAEILRAGPVRISHGPNAYLAPTGIPFDWHYLAAHPAEPMPTGLVDLEQTVPVALELQPNPEWLFLSRWGLFPRMVFNLNWVGNPSFCQALQACLPRGSGLASLYMGLASLGPVTQAIFYVSPELLEFWAKAPSMAHRRFLFAGAWNATAFEVPELPAEPPQELRDMRPLLTGKARADLRNWLQELRAYQLQPLVPLLITRQTETYSQTLYSLSDARTYLWVDFRGNADYSAQMPEETVEVRVQGYTFTEALENLPVLVPVVGSDK